MRNLLFIDALSPQEREAAKRWINCGVLAAGLSSAGSCYFSKKQFLILQYLDDSFERPVRQLEDLNEFSVSPLIYITADTAIIPCQLSTPVGNGEEILLELLPQLALECLGAESAPLIYLRIPNSEQLAVTCNQRLADKFSKLCNLFDTSWRRRSIQFARSAQYLGSKARIAGALTTLAAASSSKHTKYVDLMCGSGAVTGALSSLGAVLSSDAQKFSRLLALVQGGGMSQNRTQEITEGVLHRARPIFEEVCDRVRPQLDLENDFLTTEPSEELERSFVKWIKEFPRPVASGEYAKEKKIFDEIRERRLHRWAKPPTLFTRYYSNLYFGIRQAAEIDALRVAIESINDDFERSWALGVLVVAVSACADTYGGHFAQPKLHPRNDEKIRSVMLNNLKMRSHSVFHEFASRFAVLARQSEKVSGKVVIVPGPWEKALFEAEKCLLGEDVTVYIDPPYTRDEYSRYYHVLETLVHYNYPEVSGNALIPSRGSESRFASEFFTRNASDLHNILLSLVNKCLSNNWRCILSYSTAAQVDISKVINSSDNPSTDVELFSVPHTYKGHGRHADKHIKELLFVIRP